MNRFKESANLNVADDRVGTRLWWRPKTKVFHGVYCDRWRISGVVWVDLVKLWAHCRRSDK